MTQTQRLALTFLCAGIIGSTPVCAADAPYPTRPVRLIVPFAPGGGTDLAGRVLAAAVNEVWGTVSMVVDNRGGAGGSIGVELAAKANPDGYTVLLATIGTHAINPALYRKKITYDHLRDFTPVAYIGSTPNVFMVHPAMPAKSLGEYIALAKASPGKLSFGSSGVGASPHMSIELMKSMAGIDIVHVPYKGASPALTDVMGGQIQASVGNLPGGPLGAIKAGKVRALGVTSAKRNKQIPDVPSFSETIPGYDVSSWYGIVAPANLPGPILAKLNRDLVTAANRPETRKRLEDQGVTVETSTPDAFLVRIRKETVIWQKVVADTGLAMTE